MSKKILNKLFYIIHWNCNSLRNKIEDLKEYILINKPNIVCINETKCND